MGRGTRGGFSAGSAGLPASIHAEVIRDATPVMAPDIRFSMIGPVLSNMYGEVPVVVQRPPLHRFQVGREDGSTCWKLSVSVANMNSRALGIGAATAGVIRSWSR